MTTDLNPLILSIYDAAVDPTLWPGVLDSCAAVSGAVGCAIFEFHQDASGLPFRISHGGATFPVETIRRYNLANIVQELKDREGAKRLVSKADPIEAISDEIVYNDYEEFLSRGNVRSLMDVGLRHRVIAFLNKDNLDVRQFTLQYPDGRGPATKAELARLNVLLPHLAKAMELGAPAMELMAGHQRFLSAVELLDLGVCVLDTQNRIVLENSEFERQRQDLKVFRKTPDGRLCFGSAADQERFEWLGGHVLNHGKFGGRPRREVITNRDGTTLCLEIVKVGQIAELSSQAFDGVVVFSRDTSNPVMIDANAVKRAFQLTDAETALVEQIADGLTNVQIAKQNGRAVPTINGQVKSILAKTRCANRTQFVRLLTSFRMPGTSGTVS